MSAFEEFVFEVFIRAFGDPILGIIVFMIILGSAMFMNKIPASAALPIAYVFIAGILLAMPDSQYLEPIQAVILMGGGILIVLGILRMSKR